MKHARDMQHPLTDQFASELYVRTPIDQVPELAAFVGQTRQVCENADPLIRQCFRDRARRFMAGDLSVEAWRLGIKSS